jgi:hypothetical protein
MSYGGMIVHDSYVSSIITLLDDLGVCALLVRRTRGVAFIVSVARPSPACCKTLESVHCS